MPLDSAVAREQIETCPDLPTLPTVASHIIAMANSTQTNAADVGRMIERDPSITAKVLRLVNSAFYGFPGQIKTIQHAVVIIGFSKVKSIVMTASLLDLSKGHSGRRLSILPFWEHSLGVGFASRVAAEKMGGAVQPEDAFVAGLIHDLGKLILDLVMPEDYAPCFWKVEEEGGLLLAAEKEHLGFDHSHVGHWVTEKWNLPRAIRQAIRHHHNPTAAREERDIVAAVHVGDILARALGIGNGGDDSIPIFHKDIVQQHNIDALFLDGCLQAVLSEMASAREFFDMIGGEGS